MKKLACFLMALGWLLAASGCVTEVTGGPFKQPTEKDKEQAVSLFVQMAYMRLDRGQYDKAMALLNKAFEIDEDSPVARTALAVAYQYQGEKAKAEKSFHQVIRQNPDYTDAYYRYAEFLLAEKRYEQSCKQFSRPAEDDFYERRAQAFFNIGICNRELGKLDLAERAFSRCLDLQPTHSPVLIELSDLSFRRKAYPEAKKYFDRYSQQIRESGQPLSARALWQGIQLERIFGNRDAEASYALMLKNTHPYSAEYLQYLESLKK